MLRKLNRLLVSMFLVGGAALGGWVVWDHFEARRTIARQRRIIAELGRKLDRVWATSLVGDLRVDKLSVDKSGRKVMFLTFVQYAPGSKRPLLVRPMKLLGDEVYVDVLVAKFQRRFVDRGDGLRGKSLLLFRRAFGNAQAPDSGTLLFRQAGEISLVPELVRVDERPTAFERKIWKRFWDYANDPKLAASAGIRVAQGEAPHIKVVQGQVYKLTLRASGGLDITPRLPRAVVGKPQPVKMPPPARGR